jgi:hypothetical protein
MPDELVSSWQRQYKITDHPGSGREVLAGSGQRLNHIDKASKREDLDVRKYNAGTGRFGSFDVLWEQCRSLMPYHYCGEHPLRESDPILLIDPVSTRQEPIDNDKT